MSRLTLSAPLATLTLCLLTACGGGGGSDGTVTPPPPPPPAAINPEGIWHGSAKSSVNELTIDLATQGMGSAYAILNAANGTPAEAWYMSGFSTETFTPGNLVGAGDGYYRHVAGGFYETVAMAAMTPQSGSSKKTLQFQVAPGLSGTPVRSTTVNYDSQYDKAVTMSQVLGSYSSKFAGNTISGLTLSNVNSNSALISNNPACVFSNSRMGTLDGNKNLFSVLGIFSGTACGFQGAATGVGYAELGSDGQVTGINIALRATDGKGFYVFQGKKN